MIVYDSRDEAFKMPIGPSTAGQQVQCRLLVDRAVPVNEARIIVLFDHNGSEASYRMAEGETKTETDRFREYRASFLIHDTGLYWYHFEIRVDGTWIPIWKAEDGNRAVFAPTNLSWQQTVYERKYEVPKWIEGGVFYHIFVDRFFHAGKYVEMPGKITRRDWGGVPVYQPDEKGRILNNDFFGGNLRGIMEKLPYLQSLGVTCLYLSPIFSAYSNHKYDTCDYEKIDPMFGTEDDFRELCEKAGARGMRVILDGVFAHTGSDSVYFDKEGKYGGGAYRHPESKYRSWYFFHNREHYDTWWGIDTLPKLNKDDPSYREFICGENGVARKWLRAGASGWRLDVADELPVSFMEPLAAAVKAEKPDALLVGEVWEDASKKTAYGERKNYFEGDKLDSVMNYPLRGAIIDFVRNGNAGGLKETVESEIENYPPDVVNCLMNHLGTHDTERILTALGGKDLGFAPSRDQEAAESMSPEEREEAVRKLKIAAALQMTLPGVPCVYYGDEAGVEGYADPFNRTCFPWGKEDRDLQNWYRKLIRIRRHFRVYREGRCRTVACWDGMYAFSRFDGHERIITAANCGKTPAKLSAAGKWRDLLTGERYRETITVFPGQVLILARDGMSTEERNMAFREEYEKWLASGVVDEKTKEELRGLAGNDREIEGRFSEMLEFGTAGLRGVMRAGLNGMNVYTVRYATQALANVIHECGEDASGGVSISYDCRNNSRLFAEEAASVLAANDIQVRFFDELRPTPELSFAIRRNGSIAGINITASHNTKEYNGYKVYWADGAQLPPAHAAEISSQMEEFDIFEGVRTTPFDEAVKAGLVTMMGAEMDEAYLEQVLAQSVARKYVDEQADSLRIIYTPFHGTGYRLVPEVLKRDGLKHVLTVPEQMVIDGNFPTVKSPNPEFVEGFALAIDLAEKNDVDIIIGTDPDGDRTGVVVRTESGDYQALTGNQIGVLLLDFLIRVRRENGTLAPDSVAVKSIVSTTMANEICRKNDVTMMETLTGFKYIGEKIREFEETGSHTFLFGFEESNGYLAGTYARDKDAVVASMLVAEMACWYRSQGLSLYEGLQQLYRTYGYFREKVISHVFDGFDVKPKMEKIMNGLRKKPPVEIGGLRVLRIRDYQTGLIVDVDRKESSKTGLPESDVLFYELENGCTAVIRPSGTEPKIKYYVMARGESAEEADRRLAGIVESGDALLKA